MIDDFSRQGISIMQIKSALFARLPRIGIFSLIFCAAALSGCGKSTDSASSSESVAGSGRSSGVDQSQEKYGLFVKAFNKSSELKQNYNRFESNDFNKKHLDYINYLQSWYVAPTIDLLKQAIAIKASTPALDDLTAQARIYLDALEKFRPVDDEMETYMRTKVYLNDDMAKVRARAAQYVAAYEVALKANHGFYLAIENMDYKRAEEEYDKAAPNSVQKALAGISLHGKQSMKAFDEIVAQPKPNDVDIKKLNSTIDLLQADLVAIKQFQQVGCRAIPDYTSSYIGDLRSFAKSVADNPAKPPASSGWASSVGDTFNRMVDNQNGSNCG